MPLERVEVFADLPPEMHQLLVARARVEDLRADEEVSSFGVALVIDGDAIVCATIVETPAARPAVGSVVPARGSLADGLALRVLAGPAGLRVAVWDHDVIQTALRSCSWVLSDLTATADRLQALAGLTMGPLGDLDETTRQMITAPLELRVLTPFQMVTDAGDNHPGFTVVGAGSLERVGGGTPARPLRPGELLFPAELLRGDLVPQEVRAGAEGAVILFATRHGTQELLSGVPPLLELLGSAS